MDGQLHSEVIVNAESNDVAIIPSGDAPKLSLDASRGGTPIARFLQRWMKTLTLCALCLLLAVSLAAAIGFCNLWSNFEHGSEITNMSSAFLGFITAAIINIFACFAGISTVKASTTEQGLEHEHDTQKNAVVYILIAGLIFSIVFPSCGLLPLDADRMTRVHRTTLSECFEHTKMPQCKDAKMIQLSLQLMYGVVPIEILALVTYGLWLFGSKLDSENWKIWKRKDRKVLDVGLQKTGSKNKSLISIHVISEPSRNAFEIGDNNTNNTI